MSKRQIGVALLLCCAAVTGSSAQQAAPASVFAVDASGVARHAQSGLVCPKAFDGFIREALTLYDKMGLDVSCDYASKTDGVLTLYATYNDPRHLAQDFADAQAALKETFPRAVPRPKSMAPMPVGEGWLAARYDAKKGGFYSDVFMASIGGWEIAIRASYPREKQPEMTGAATKMFLSLLAESKLHRPVRKN